MVDETSTAQDSHQAFWFDTISIVFWGALIWGEVG
jgi:hypothetical protein